MSHILTELAQPFPEKYVHKNPSGGGTYIKHHVIEQRLIQVFGRPPNFEVVHLIRGDVAAIPPNPEGSSKRAKDGAPALTDVVVSVVARLSIDVDGQVWIAEEAGDCEEPHNWKTDGQRLKDAMSDAYKRCAMRWGCGLHLWSQDEYFLFEQLSAAGTDNEGTTRVGEVRENVPAPASGDPEREVGRAATPSPVQDQESGSAAASRPPGTAEPQGAEDQPSASSPADFDPDERDGYWHLIDIALSAGQVKVSDVLRAASEPAKLLERKPPTKRDDLKVQPTEVLSAVCEALHLGQWAAA